MEKAPLTMADDEVNLQAEEPVRFPRIQMLTGRFDYRLPGKA
jgi:hypothetical protein